MHESPNSTGDHPNEPTKPSGLPDPDTDLDPIDESIVELLARRHTHEEIAETLDISTRTVSRRMSDPALKAVMMTRRREVLAESTAQLVALSHDAVNTLAALLGSDSQGIQLRAVQTALGLGRRYHHEDRLESEFEQRIEHLERIRKDDDLEEK